MGGFVTGYFTGSVTDFFTFVTDYITDFVTDFAPTSSPARHRRIVGVEGPVDSSRATLLVSPPHAHRCPNDARQEVSRRSTPGGMTCVNGRLRPPTATRPIRRTGWASCFSRTRIMKLQLDETADSADSAGNANANAGGSGGSGGDGGSAAGWTLRIRVSGALTWNDRLELSRRMGARLVGADGFHGASPVTATDLVLDGSAATEADRGAFLGLAATTRRIAASLGIAATILAPAAATILATAGAPTIARAAAPTTATAGAPTIAPAIAPAEAAA
jgi:hypothetical protein